MTRTLNDRAVRFLEGRGIDIELAVQEGMFSAAPDATRKRLEPNADGNWLAMPNMVDGHQTGCKYRKTDGKMFQQDKGSQQILYRRQAIRGARRIVLTEGELDALSAVQAGYPATASVPGGAPLETGKKSHAYFEEAEADLRHADEIILAFDDDAPGHALFEDTKAILGPARCKFVTYPVGCKDLNDVLRQGGEEAVRAVLDAARFVPVDGIFSPADLPDLPDLRVYRAGLSPDFDTHIGICKRHTSVWTGYANHGKSMLVKQVQAALAKKYGWRIAVLSMEDDFQRNYRSDMIRALTLQPVGVLPQEDLQAANAMYDDQWILMVAPEDEDVTVPWMLDRMEAAVVRHAADMIVIDPFTEIDLQLQRGESERDAIGQVLSAFNRFARRMNVHIAIVAHPTKPSSGEQYAPTGYDVAGAAHWKNKPYLGVSIHRDPKLDDVCQIVVWKSKRRDPMGPTGTFYMRYVEDISYLTEMSRSEYMLRKDGDIR